MRNGALATALTLALVACLSPAVPPLLRDEAGIFSRAARAQAEERLQEVARRTDIWIFVITHARPDPPRLLDGPMGLADARGVRAVAVILAPDRVNASGVSRAMGDRTTMPLPGEELDRLLAAGLTDDALAEIVDAAAAWADDPDAGATPPPVPVDEAGPSG